VEQRVRDGAEAPSGGAEWLRCRASIAAAGTRVRVLRGVGPLLVGRRRYSGRAGPDKEARRRSRGKLSAGEEGGEGEGADRWGQAEGMTEKRTGITEERTRMTEKRRND
jgi:hypothetical protein